MHRRGEWCYRRYTTARPGLARLCMTPAIGGRLRTFLFFLFKQKTAYEITRCLEFRRVLFRSIDGGEQVGEFPQAAEAEVKGHIEEGCLGGCGIGIPVGEGGGERGFEAGDI